MFGLKGIGDVFEKNQAGHDVLVFGGIDAAAQFIRRLEQLVLKTQDPTILLCFRAHFEDGIATYDHALPIGKGYFQPTICPGLNRVTGLQRLSKRFAVGARNASPGHRSVAQVGVFWNGHELA
ncbi:MAG: hypothetical protein ACE5EM_07070 [Sphingomonadales bacterium]